jgi:hypothetical protein
MSGDLFAYLPPAHFAAGEQQPMSIATPMVGRLAAIEPTSGRASFCKSYDVTEGPSIRRINVRTRREVWALDCLLAAGETGCTPLSDPGPRWSGYVHKLRHNHSLNIETITEPHGGEFAGHHARYVLRSDVRPVSSDGGST